ncbi:MAG: hypothetical protein ABIL09_03960 [Gemmatimonadota bacterium]
MTHDESNRLIAEAMAKDEMWREWAWLPCPYVGRYRVPCDGGRVVKGIFPVIDPEHPETDDRLEYETCPRCGGEGRIPRDMGQPEATMRLVAWGAAQPWWFKCSEISPVSVADRVASALEDFTATGADEATAASVRDDIAEAMKEQSDGD